MTINGARFFGGALLALSLGWMSSDASAVASELNFAGVPLKGGETVRAPVPLSVQEKSYVSEGGNAVPPNAVAVIAVPANFDPQKSWPVLICLSTSDFRRKNRDDLEDFYRWAGLAEGWVLLAGDGEGNPPHDTAGWRAGMTLAALDALHRSFPGSGRWPIAVAGYSGGAKRAGTIAPLLAVAGNEIARVAQQQQVKRTIEQTGFTRIRLIPMPHGHAVSRSAIREALRWFRELQGPS